MAEIHIQIKLAGKAWPTASEMKLRHDIEDAIENQNIGEIVDRGAGLGVADIYIEVQNAAVESALAAVNSVVHAVGASRVTTVTLVGS